MSEEQFTTETMADYEGQFDNADPWHIVSKYMEQQTDLPVKIEGIVNGGLSPISKDSVDLSLPPSFLSPISKILRLIFSKRLRFVSLISILLRTASFSLPARF